MSESDIRADEAGDAWSPEDDLPHPAAAEYDAVDQRQDAAPTAPAQPVAVPFDVDPADAAEQQHAVDYDEDDYR